MSTKIVLGFDPGLSGGYSAVNAFSGDLVFTRPLPLKTFQLSNAKATINGHELFSMLRPFVPTIQVAIIEEVSAAPNQGVVSMFNFGMGYGILLGVLQSLDIRILKVRPAVWKSALNLSSSKAQSLALANSKWPEHAELWSKKKNDGLAESALLAYYGCQNITRPTL